MNDPKDEAEPIGPVYGPQRRAPMFWAGETYGTARGKGTHPRGRTPRGLARGKKQVRYARGINYPDVERRPNGTVPSIRNKHMRRIIRGALKRKFSRVESGLGLPRAMLTQAMEIAKENGKSNRWAKRLFEQELAIHRAVYVPDARATRTQKRKDKRSGKVDAITALVDRISK